MEEKEKKKQIAKISIFITSIFVIFISVTYAFINMTLTGTRRQMITAGNIALELLEDENNLTITNAMPMYDEVGMVQDAFTFRLVNKTATDTNYIVKLVDITTGDKLDTSIVKYGFRKDGAVTIDLLSNLTENELDKGVITGNQTISYSLRLWIDSSVEDNTVISGKSLSYRIDVEVGQELVQENNLPIISKYSSTGENFYSYKAQITDVIFENKINVPNDIAEDKKWDVSEEKNGSVMAYIEEDGTLENGDTAYKLHIQGNDRIVANEDSRNLFYNFSKLVMIEGLEYFDTSSVTNMSHMFRECSSLTSLDLSNFNTTNVTSMSTMFYGCSSLTNLNLSSFDTVNVTNMSHMFRGCSNLTTLDISKFNTSKVTNMTTMFYDCSSLTTLDVGKFNTSKVTNMSYLFYGCRSLTTLDVSNFNTTNVTNMSYMFRLCNSLTSLGLSNFDTTNVTDMSFMFQDCSSLVSLDLSSFDTTNVTNMSQIFSGCSNLTNLDLSSFDTTNVTNMNNMFSECSSLTSLNLSRFNTKNVTNMFSMFYGCSGLTSLDLSNFDTTNVTNMSNMFSGCSGLTKLDLSIFDTTNVTNKNWVFYLVKTDCLIIVKDSTTKAWVLEQNSQFDDKFTNVVIKS